jgi:hypothetical protein
LNSVGKKQSKVKLWREGFQREKRSHCIDIGLDSQSGGLGSPSNTKLSNKDHKKGTISPYLPFIYVLICVRMESSENESPWTRMASLLGQKLRYPVKNKHPNSVGVARGSLQSENTFGTGLREWLSRDGSKINEPHQLNYAI